MGCELFSATDVCNFLVFEMVPSTNDERVLFVVEEFVTEPKVDRIFCTSSPATLHNAIGHAMKIEQFQEWHCVDIVV